LKKYSIIILISFNFLSWHVNAQDTLVNNLPTFETYEFDAKLHSPVHAAMLSAALPGLGQIYNKKYWKLPLIYGGATALMYLINYNNNEYIFYREAYYDAKILKIRNEEFVKRYSEANPNADLGALSVDYIMERSEKGKEYYLKYRDYCIMGMVGLYLLNIMDANVDAFFLNFDVSKDLTAKIKPFVDNFLLSENIIGVKLSLEYK